ncbi:MAG: hypothetical protein PHP35_02875 [Candidatus Colwellbacteria bacterium]|nr:hypothetical protein [Candidatus Colwellbacteria bacterium]
MNLFLINIILINSLVLLRNAKKSGSFRMSGSGDRGTLIISNVWGRKALGKKAGTVITNCGGLHTKTT